MPLALVAEPGLDDEACYAAIRSRDPRFDGRFVTAVRSTGIYCRPSCPALTPRRGNVGFVRTAAAAQHAGYRACKRCRPDAAPGSAEWDVRADVGARAIRLVEDGVVDREGVDGLAHRLGYSARHLRRALTAELGAGPLTLARAQRARTARLLLETTDLRTADVAFAAGFKSVRQCNETVHTVYGTTPTALRDAGSRCAGSPDAGSRPTGSPNPGPHQRSPSRPDRLTLRLLVREPAGTAQTLAFLGAHAIRGLEAYDGTTYARSLALPHGPATVRLRDGPGAVLADLRLTDLRDVAAAVARCRHLLDLDADPVAVDEHLAGDLVLGPLVARFPGRRVAGAHDGAEIALRTVLGQQISLGAARTLGAKLVAEYGAELDVPDGSITHLFPDPAALAAVDPATLSMPGARAKAVTTLAGALADGLRLDPGADRDAAEHALLTLPGIGPWTARYVRMRACADPDVWLVEDLAVRRAAAELGLSTAVADLKKHGCRWAPWGSYATGLLWAHVLAGPTVPTRPATSTKELTL